VSGPEGEMVAATSVRQLLDGRADRSAVVDEMSGRLPAPGVARDVLAEEELPARRRLLERTYRLLDSEILLAAARCLDQDVAGPVADWLKRFRELRAAAERTLADQTTRETVELDVLHTLTAQQDVAVRMYVDRKRIGTFPFRLLLTAALGVTKVVVQGGAIHQIDCVAASLKAGLTFADVTPALWERSAREIALHLPLAEPLRIPLVPVPRSAAGAARQKVAPTP
jgi:hypothetical protein